MSTDLNGTIGIRAAPSSTRFDGCSTHHPYHGQPSHLDTTGSLRNTASGHVRYMPQSLAWDPNSNLPDSTGSSDLRSSPLGSSVDMRTLLASLPPTSVCTELVRIYFSSFASLFHVLHDPTFWRQYEMFLQDAESVRLEWLALLYTVLATAIIALSPDHSILSDLSRKRTAPEKMRELSENWRGMALRCLEADQYLWRHSVGTLQCLVLMIYSIGHTHGQTWTLLGLANHLAQSIGCHTDPEGFSISSIEKEERRRCWAALMMLYTHQNTTIGMIGSPRVWMSAGPKLPADINDEDVEATHVRYDVGRAGATQMTYLLLKFRLYDICAEIAEKVLSKSEQPSMNMIRALDAAICDEQSSWSQRYPTGSSLQAHHAAHVNVLYSYSDHLTLLLHQEISLGDSFGDTVRTWSQGRQLESAKRILRTHAVMESDPDLAPFRWYNRGLGSFHAFHAAVVLSSLMRVNADVREARERHQLFHSCLARLQALSESNSMCAKAATILQRLP